MTSTRSDDSELVENWFGGPRNKPREQRKDMRNIIHFMGTNWVKQSNNPVRIPNKFPGLLTPLEATVFYRLPKCWNSTI